MPVFRGLFFVSFCSSIRHTPLLYCIDLRLLATLVVLYVSYIVQHNSRKFKLKAPVLLVLVIASIQIVSSNIIFSVVQRLTNLVQYATLLTLAKTTVVPGLKVNIIENANYTEMLFLKNFAGVVAAATTSAVVSSVAADCSCKGIS